MICNMLCAHLFFLKTKYGRKNQQFLIKIIVKYMSCENFKFLDPFYTFKFEYIFLYTLKINVVQNF